MEDKDLKQEPDNRPEEAIDPEAASDAVPAENAAQSAEAESAPSCGEAVEAADAEKEPSDMNGDEPPVEELSAEEQAKITAAQQKADTKYHEVLGDRRIKKPGKFAARVIAVIVVILLVFFIVAKLPMFYNCMTPGSTDTITNLPELTGSDDFGDAAVGDRVWQLWYEYNENRGENEFNERSPLGDAVSKDIFATAEENIADEYAQVNLLCGTKYDVNNFEDGSVEYLTVIMYKFGSVEESTAYGERKADELGGNHEFKDLLFFKLGMAQATTDNFVYDAWYNGGTYIEIYCTDADIASQIRTLINHNS